MTGTLIVACPWPASGELVAGDATLARR